MKNKILFNTKSRKEVIQDIQGLKHQHKSYLSRADRFLNGTILFQNDWDMERTQVEEAYSLDNMDWNYCPTEDLEWSYMFHRLGYLQDLVVAYVISEDKKYIEHLNRFLKLYLEKNLESEENSPFSWRTIDVGIRLINLMRIDELLNVLELDSVIDQKVLKAHKTYLYNNLEIKRSLSNWSTIESSAILMYALYTKDLEIFAEVYEFFEHTLKLQILDDGLQWEQSFMYHHEVFIRVLQVIQSLKAHEKTIPTQLMNYSIKMATASEKISRVNQTQSNFGDSDYEDMSAILFASSKILNVPLVNFDKETELFDYLLTFDTQKISGKIEKNIEKYELKEAGLSIIKDYDKMDNFMFSNGPLGGGHGHDDYLHFEYMVDGNDFLVDSGRYTYYESEGSRLYYKKPTSHNTITLNNKSYNEHTSSWESKKVGTPINEKSIHGEKISYFEGGHFGYSNESLKYINRKIIYTKNRKVLIIDSYKGDTNEMLNAHFILYPNLDYNFDENKLLVTIKHTTMEITSLSENVSFELNQQFISPQYNKSVETQRLTINKLLKNGHMTTVIQDANTDSIRKVSVYNASGNQFEDTTVECYQYTTDDIDWHVLIQHEEPSNSRTAYFVGDFMFYGRLIYFGVRQGEIIYEEKLY